MDPHRLTYHPGIPKLISEIVDLPTGAQVRVRLRNDEMPCVFVRTEAGIRKFVLGSYKGRFYLGHEQAANLRPMRHRPSSMSQ